MAGFIDKLHLLFYILKQKMYVKPYPKFAYYTVQSQIWKCSVVILDFRIFWFLEIMKQ